jgi:lia operon protein LiaI
MKKFGLLLLGGVAAVVLLTNVGHLVGLAISLVILYYAYKGFKKSESTFSKVVWATLGIIALMTAASNFPAILGGVAAYVLYVVYKKWKLTDQEVISEDDPFTNFEKQWAELKKTY